MRKAIEQSPRRSGPGPNGSRFEHWKTLLADSAALEANCRVAVAFLLGVLPGDFTTANLGARLVALRKKNGKLRPVACGSVLRRLAAKAACEVFKEELKDACGPYQSCPCAGPYGLYCDPCVCVPYGSRSCQYH